MNIEEFEDAKGVIRIRRWKDRQHNGQKENDKSTNNDLQNTTQKTKDRATRTPLKTRVKSSAPEGSSVHAPHVAQYLPGMNRNVVTVIVDS